MNELLEQYIQIRKNLTTFSIESLSILNITGRDATTFLNNQTTNDVSNLGLNQFHVNSVLDIKAKVIAPFLLLNLGSEFKLIVNIALKDNLIERLNKYLISEDVNLEQSEEPFYFTSLKSDISGSLFNQQLGIEFGEAKDSINEKDSKIIEITTAQPLDLMFHSVGKIFNNTILQQIGYSSKKGCFLGQEIVSKIEVNRKASYYPMLLCSESLFTEDGLRVGGRKVGSVMASEGFYGLADLIRDCRIDSSSLELEQGIVKVFSYPLFKDEIELSELIYNYSVDLFQKGFDDKACDSFKFCLELNPFHEDACESLGVIYGRLKKYNEAIEVMKDLIKINDKSVMAHTNLSLFYMNVGEIEKAEEEKSNATFKSFEFFGDEAKRKQKEADDKKKLEDELIRKVFMFKQVLEIDEDDVLANYGMGEACFKMSKFDEAVQRLEKVISLQKNYSVAYLNLGKSYLGLNQINKAKEIFCDGIKVAAKNGDMMPANEMQSILNKL